MVETTYKFDFAVREEEFLSQQSLDGYPSLKLRDSHCRNVELLFYALLCDAICMAALVYWQMEVPLALLSLIPLLANASWLVFFDQAQQAVLVRQSNKARCVVYSVYVFGGVFVVFAAFLALMSVIALFTQSYEAYYPALGWGFMNVLCFCTAVANIGWAITLVRLVYELRAHYCCGDDSRRW